MYTWPPSDYCDEGRRLAGVSDDAVFIGKKVVGRNFRWDCKAPGAGMAGRYGNGSIFVYGDDCVEMLTPMLGYEPELPEQNAVNQKVSIDQKTPETIYLIPGEDVDGAPCMVWCDDPAPGEGMDPSEAVEYIRADKCRDWIKQLETMVKVFRGCIETGLMPEPGSPCQKKVFELVGESEGGGKA